MGKTPTTQEHESCRVDAIGLCGLLVHAISEEAKAFYVRLGLDREVKS